MMSAHEYEQPGKENVTTVKTLHILLLEDNKDDSELIIHLLRNAGMSFDARRVDSRDAFLNEIVHYNPDIILVDYSLPQFSALEAFELLKEHGYSIPIILITGTQSEEIAVECMKRGADDYILKQNLTRLPAAIQNVVEKKNIQREKEKAEAALRKSEEKFRKLFSHNPLPLFVYDTETLRFIEVNDAAIAHYGYSQKEFSDMTVTDIRALEIHPQLKFPQPYPKGLSNISGHWTHRTKNGTLKTVQIINQPLEMNDRKTALMIATDITEQTIAAEKLKRSHEHLRALSDRLQSVREEERTQIAREIHDELGQILTAIRMDLSWLANKLNELAPQFNGVFQTHTSSMTTLVDSAIHTVRKISTELRPQILDDLGLVAAIEWQAHEFQARTGISCTFLSNVEDIRLDRKQATALFRILQESLTNIARHAEATQTRITLSAHSNAILLEIVDNGIGIKEEEIANITSLGVLGMHERTVLLGGIFSIQNTPEGRGTMISVQLPLSHVSYGSSQ